MIAMIFILFDIEVIFLIPWAVIFKKFALPENGYAFFVWAEMILFMLLLVAGYIYIWRKGAFDWGQRARREAKAEARALKDMEERKKLEETKRAA
jgi:NADH-quinone oxidoreductase subunit A